MARVLNQPRRRLALQSSRRRSQANGGEQISQPRRGIQPVRQQNLSIAHNANPTWIHPRAWVEALGNHQSTCLSWRIFRRNPVFCRIFLPASLPQTQGQESTASSKPKLLSMLRISKNRKIPWRGPRRQGYTCWSQTFETKACASSQFPGNILSSRECSRCTRWKSSKPN